MKRLIVVVALLAIAAFTGTALAKGHSGGHSGSHNTSSHSASSHHTGSHSHANNHTNSAKHSSHASKHSSPNKNKPNSNNNATPATNATTPTNTTNTTVDAGNTGLTHSRGYHRGYGHSYRHVSHRRGYRRGRPTFVIGQDPVVAINSGRALVNPWAMQISAGSNRQGTGTAHFQVTADSNPGLFSQRPSVSPTGALSFAPAAGQSGMATLTLVLRSSGGASAPQTFHITVKPA